jgi:hypothetical protein
MIGTTIAAVLFSINVLFAALLGIAAGGLASFALRRSWGIKEVLIDALLAAVVSVLAAYLVAAVESARGVWESHVALILIIAVAGVIVRQFIRPGLRSVS